MKKFFLPLFLLCSCRLFSCAFEVPAHKFGDTKNCRLMRDSSGYFVQDGQRTHFLPHREIPSSIKSLSPEDLKRYLVGNYLVLNRINSDYTLKANGRVNGGGPVTGAIFGCTCAVVGAACTLGAAGAAFVSGHPIEAGVIAIAGTKATVAATITAAEVGTVLPTP